MLREALHQTTSNTVVNEVIAALGFMLLGNLILIGSAPSPSVACASVLVTAVMLSDSAMVDGRCMDVVDGGEWRMDERVVLRPSLSLWWRLFVHNSVASKGKERPTRKLAVAHLSLYASLSTVCLWRLLTPRTARDTFFEYSS
jgi:hypothetical protein